MGSIMKQKPIWKVLATFLGGPAAGAFGFWLLSEAPLLHRSICLAGGSI